MTKAVIYARYSPRPRPNGGDGDGHCESNEKQIGECQRYCDAKGYEVVSIHQDEALSGADADRPGLFSAMRDLKRRHVLVVRWYSRLARDSDLAGWIMHKIRQKGATVETTEGHGNGDAPGDRMLRGILQVVADFERSMIRIRTSAAMRRYQAGGRRMSAECPYGWKTDPADSKRMIPCQREREAVARILELHARGRSLRKIAHALNAEDYGTRQGRPWCHQSVVSVIRREVDSAHATLPGLGPNG